MIAANADAAQTAQTIRSLGEAVIRFADNLAHAQAVQYDRPAAPSVRETDPSRRIEGAVSNPTHDTATDPRRMRLRAAVVTAELAAESITAQASAAADDLAAALQGWAGVRW